MTDTNTVTIKVRAGGRDSEQHAVTYNIGNTLDELVAQYGKELVAAKAREKIVVNLQDYMRNNAKAGKVAELQTLADAWVPGIRHAAKTPVDKAKTLFEGLSEEDRKAVLAQFAKGK